MSNNKDKQGQDVNSDLVMNKEKNSKREDNNVSDNKKIKSIVNLLYLLLDLVVIFMVVFSLWVVQPILIFGPYHDEECYQRLQSIEAFEEIRIDNDGRLIDGWLLHNTKEDKAPLVIYYGGNVQNSSRTCLAYYYSNVYGFFARI